MGNFNMKPSIFRGKSDQVIDQLREALDSFGSKHPKAKIHLYRQNPASVRIRIIDPLFQGLSKSQRHDEVWKFLEKLDEEVQSEVSMLLLLNPDETKLSFGNMEFEDPVPSQL
jgi:stress-induced morphogen